MFLDLNHKKLEVYNISLELLKECYSLTNNFPASERHNLTQQIRRAGLSVILNLSEGASRKSATERKRFYEIARGSLTELDAALEVSVALHYIERIIAEPVGKLIVSCFKKLSTMMQTLSKQ